MSTGANSAASDGKVKQAEESSENQAEPQAEELKNLNYEILLIAFSILSVFNIVLLILIRDPTAENVLTIIDIPLTAIFFFDFILRLRTAESKSNYFFRQFGWADLTASLPFPALKILRLFRIFRAWRMIQHYGAKNLRRQLIEHRADAALSVVAFLIICVLEFGGIFVLLAERSNPDSNIKTASDAVWWAFVSITTVGYGDRYPTTNWGRIVGLFVMMTGVGLFGVLTGYLANSFLSPPKKTEEDKEPAKQESQQAQAQLDRQDMFAEMKLLMTEQEKAYEQDRAAHRAVLAEMKQLLSEQEQAHEELLSLLAGAQPLSGGVLLVKHAEGPGVQDEDGSR